MSQHFWVGDNCVWNPSNGVGLLFLRSADAIAPLVNRPTGIHPAYHLADADDWAIHLPVFERFVGALVDEYQRATHVVLRALLEGFVATAVVLVERGGGETPALSVEVGARLIELKAIHSRGMVC
ncbi:DUF6086 family protein [Actinosynnema sp. NPDC020468]|uniref:DUF6086 family protein n=1 Tax=Actinosynnema sp. NPDC020468 TaxID=3154488 RepID=UPI0033D70F31